MGYPLEVGKKTQICLVNKDQIETLTAKEGNHTTSLVGGFQFLTYCGDDPFAKQTRTLAYASYFPKAVMIIYMMASF